MEKKVIEQKEDYDVIISEDKNCVYVEQKEGLNNNLICIVLENRTTVAKAIDPGYQKVLDQNAELVEALEDLMSIKDEPNMIISFEKFWRAKQLLKEIKALQNTKNIEG